MSSITRPSRDQFEIALLCVLRSERDAIQLALDQKYETDGFSYIRGPRDRNIYTPGRLGHRYVVLVYLPEMGNIGSGAAAANIPASFPGVKLVLVVGVCGANPHARDRDGQEILLGDVIISTSVIKSSLGHQYSDGLALRTTEDTFRYATPQIKAFLNQLDSIMTVRRLRLKTRTCTEEIINKGEFSTPVYPGPENDKLYNWNYRHKHQQPQRCPTCSACVYPSYPVCETALEASCEALGCDDTFLVPRTRIEEATGCHPDGKTRVEHARQPAILFGKFASGDFMFESGYHRDKLAEEHGVIGFEMEGAGCWDYLPTIIIKGACHYADGHKNKAWQQYSAITAAACAKAIVQEWRSAQQQTAPEITERLNNIPRATEAAFDSMALQHIPACLESTRVALLARVCQWATNGDSQPIFWLQGIAGTGKTTIAKTVARTFSKDKDKSLGASFFFSRRGDDRQNAKRFFGTLVYQLVFGSIFDPHLMGTLKLMVHDAIVSRPDIFTKAYTEQWEHLVMGPLLLLEGKMPDLKCKPVVIVIDAVDECDSVADIGLILELLAQAQKLKHIPLRFFLTGRPEVSVRHQFRRVHQHFEHIILHELESTVVNSDIHTFVEHELAGVREKYDLSLDWLSPTAVETIVSKADGLFVYAAAVCRFLWSDFRRMDLPNFLQDDVDATSDLNEMYNSILVESQGVGMDGSIDDVTAGRFKLVIGSVVALFDMLSINTLHALLDSCPADTNSSRLMEPLDQNIVKTTIMRLGSVLDIPQHHHPPGINSDLPVRIFHPSFREFLLDKRDPRLERLQLDSADLHENLLNNCLASMNSSLKKDICALSDPSANGKSVSDAQLTRCLPLHVQYACKYWILHIQGLSESSSRVALSDHGAVYQFATRNILYWIEAMSLLDLVPSAVTMIVGLKTLLKDSEHHLTSTFIQDAYRFLIGNRVMIEAAPLQIYCSARLFSPSSSILTNSNASWELVRRRSDEYVAIQ
ncbi:hypothetical protein BDW59DRAFT_36049 [Aspergillus cavernicola]|uniref:NACHT domain-containing protein n=1 Tax=Aspergillus cavernicola TaxID=176166 RepID=A0ABR4IP12_9EURO